ncbi:MAG: DUF1553 domain-containing protein, partial [Planctomycetes bacterium]|nr:DUF1553 domain-containing protein [Planctomycetota bacterium]
TSSTYRQKSALGPGSAKGEKVDPANRLLWRMNLRRLDSEYVRDAILAVSGSLNRSLYGPPLPLHVRPDGMVVIKEDGLPTPTSKYRRSIYILARRNYHLTMLRVFDQPIVATHCTVRKPSAVVTQSLTLLHDDFVVEQAGLFADRVIGRAEQQTEQQQIETAFRIALGRPPDQEEMQWSVDLLRRHVTRLLREKTTNDEAHRIAITHVCHMLFNTNEFLYVE